MTAMPSIRSTKELVDYINRGHRPKFVFFWGHQPGKNESIGKACLSQWYESAFVIDGITYPTAEHYMMAEKARLFRDENTLQMILSAWHPGEAKKLGRRVAGFDESVWAAHRFDIVVRANLAKFSQHPPLRRYLLGTGERVLVEASPVDPIWGIGMAETDADAQNPNLWRGLNLLGFALMQVRECLRQG